MPCYRSCKKFVPRSPPPTYDEALHQYSSSSLHLSVGAYAARHHPGPLSHKSEGEYTYTYMPIPQAPAIVPHTSRFIVPPHYDLDDYIEHDSEEADEDEDEDAWDSDNEDDQEEDEDEDEDEGHHYHYDGALKVLAATPLCLLVLLAWASYFA